MSAAGRVNLPKAVSLRPIAGEILVSAHKQAIKPLNHRRAPPHATLTLAQPRRPLTRPGSHSDSRNGALFPSFLSLSPHIPRSSTQWARLDCPCRCLPKHSATRKHRTMSRNRPRIPAKTPRTPPAASSTDGISSQSMPCPAADEQVHVLVGLRSLCHDLCSDILPCESRATRP